VLICTAAILLAINTTAGATVASGCPSFGHTFHRTVGGQRWNFSDWIFSIRVQGADCSRTAGLIVDADQLDVNRPAGVYRPVDGWQCRRFSPSLNARGFSQWTNDCEGPGDRQLSWLEDKLHAQPTASLLPGRLDGAQPAAAPSSPSSCSSSGDSSILAAPMFSSRCSTEAVPGIGSITGER
jgi:hypothetical protein